MSDEHELQATIDEARERLNAIKRAKAEAANRALVGRTFRYRNCYSCPEKPSDYWWVWRVVEGTDGFGLRVRDFAVDKYGEFTMRRERILILRQIR